MRRSRGWASTTPSLFLPISHQPPRGSEALYLRSVREFYRAPGGRRVAVAALRRGRRRRCVPGARLKDGARSARSLNAPAAKMAAGSGFTRPTGKEGAQRQNVGGFCCVLLPRASKSLKKRKKLFSVK